MTDKPDLTRVWAVDAPSGNVIDPSATTPDKFSDGWTAEVPPFEHFNFIQKFQTQGLAHINEQGIAVWDDVTTYPVGGLAKGSDGNVYKALVSQSDNDPVSDDGTNWDKEPTKADLISEVEGKGASLVSMEGGPTVESAVLDRVIRVGSVASGFAGRTGVSGYQYSVLAWHDGGAAENNPVGGGIYTFNESRDKADHNGGTVISPTVPAATPSTVEDFLDAVNETDPAGTGCFELLNQSIVFVEQFGAIADNNGNAGNGFDNWASFNKIINYSEAYEIRTRNKNYRSSDEINVKRRIRMIGGNSGTADTPTSRIFFDTDVSGIIIHRSNTYSNRLEQAGDPTGSGEGSIIDAIGLYGDGTDVSKHGFWMRARSTYTNYTVNGFPGNGVQIVAVFGGSASVEGNANNWYLANGRSRSNGLDGHLVEGSDVNAGTGINIDGTDNAGWGITDNSFLGCTWIGTHTAGNTTGPHRALNDNSRSTFIGPYTEPGQNPAFMSRNSISIGGHHLTGTTGRGAHWHNGTLESVERLRTSGTNYGDTYLENNAQTGRQVVIGNSASISDSRTTHLGFEVDGFIIGSLYGRSKINSGLGTHVLGLEFYNNTSETYSRELRFDGSQSEFYPDIDGSWSLGSASNKWSEVFAAAGTINTSDEREKQQQRSVSEAEQLCAVDLKSSIKAYKFNTAVETKGDSARWHFGLMAQRVVEVFNSHGLNAHEYGMLCYDEWEKEYDEDDNIIKESGNIYGVRYDEIMMFILASS